jgi:hypothetical protein
MTMIPYVFPPGTGSPVIPPRHWIAPLAFHYMASEQTTQKTTHLIDPLLAAAIYNRLFSLGYSSCPPLYQNING